MLSFIYTPQFIQVTQSTEWYQSNWMYLLYALSFLVFIFLVLRWRTKQLIIEREGLLGKIDDATSKVKKQAEKLKLQSQNLSRRTFNLSLAGKGIFGRII